MIFHAFVWLMYIFLVVYQFICFSLVLAFVVSLRTTAVMPPSNLTIIFEVF